MANLDDQVYGQSFSLCSQSEWGDLLRTWQRYDRPRLFWRFWTNIIEGQFDIHQTSEQLGSQEAHNSRGSHYLSECKREILALCMPLHLQVKVKRAAICA